jgi:hypothetical protein
MRVVPIKEIMLDLQYAPLDITVIETSKLTPIMKSGKDVTSYRTRRFSEDFLDFVIIGGSERLKSFALSSNRTESGDVFLVQYKTKSVFAQLVRSSWQEGMLLITFLPVSRIMPMRK